MPRVARYSEEQRREPVRKPVLAFAESFDKDEPDERQFRLEPIQLSKVAWWREDSRGECQRYLSERTSLEQAPAFLAEWNKRLSVCLDEGD